MSTKATIFLTGDNEHCYFETSEPLYDEHKQWIGDTIILELDKKNIEVLCNDETDLIVSIKPGTELHSLIGSIKEISR